MPFGTADILPSAPLPGRFRLSMQLRPRRYSIARRTTCDERLQAAVDEARSSFISQKVRNLTKRASLRYPEADMRSIDFSEGPGLDRVAVAELAACGFAERGDNVVLLGPKGTGKTHLSCALAKAACAKRVRTCYIRQPDLEDLRRESRDRSGGERKPLRKYGAFGLLVIDEWLLERPDELFRGCFWSISSCATGGRRPSCVRSSERKASTRGSEACTRTRS